MLCLLFQALSLNPFTYSKLYTMRLEVISPSELKDFINEIYYRHCIQPNTPDKIEAVLFEIDNIRAQYAIQEQYELCEVCNELKEELIVERDTRIANDLGEELISLLR